MKWDKVESGERAEDAVIHALITAPSLDTHKCRTLTQRAALLMNVDYEVIDAIVSNPHAMMEKVFLILSRYYHLIRNICCACVCMIKQSNTTNHQVAVTNSRFLFLIYVPVMAMFNRLKVIQRGEVFVSEYIKYYHIKLKILNHSGSVIFLSRRL